MVSPTRPPIKVPLPGDIHVPAAANKPELTMTKHICLKLLTVNYEK